MSAEKQPVRVTILSRPYTLLASGDPREVEEVASSVNELMLSIAAKVFSLVLAIIALSKSYVDFRGRRESFSMLVFWTGTWVLIIVFALFPSLVDVLLSFSGSERVGLGTFFGMALVFLYFIVYRLYVKLERIEQNLIKVVQELALRDNWVKRP